MKRLVAFALCLILGVSALCGYVGTAAAQASAAQTAPLEQVTLTAVNVAAGTASQLADTPVGQAFIEKTGVNIQMEFSIGDENQTIALMIASGDLPDLIIPHYKVAPFVDANCALDLTPYLEQYAPNYIERLGERYDRMVWSADDPGRYYITGPDSTTADKFEQMNWFFLQHDVVIDQNYPTLRTLADYEKAIETYMQAHPTVDGQPAIGLTLLCDSWYWILSLTNPAMMAAGTECSGEFFVDPVTHEVTYRVLTGNEKEYFRWLNGMYGKGLLDPEAFTQTLDQYKAKIATGRVLATTNMYWVFSAACTTLRQEGKDERLYGSYPITIDESVVNSAFSGPRTLTTPSMNVVVSSKTKHADRIAMLLDYLITDEGQILNSWGIEGQHHDLIDGVRMLSAEERLRRNTDTEYGDKTGVGSLSWLCSYQDGMKGADGQYLTTASTESTIANYTDVDKQILAAYGVETWAGLFKQASDFELRMWPAENATQDKLPADSDGAIAYARCQDVVKKGVVRAIMTAPEEFDAMWTLFEQEMVEAGVETYEKAIEDLMREQMTQWGYEF